MSESEIIAKVLGGDTAQYGLLVERYQPGLVYHCFAIVGDEDLANDLAQEACIKAYLQLKRYREDYRFSTWLYKIATNLCLDYLKKRRHVSLDDIPELPSNLASLQSQIETSQEADRLHRTVRRLPLKFQTVISLYYWNDHSYEEISDIMNVPVNTVRTWLRRAKAQLKEELDG